MDFNKYYQEQAYGRLESYPVYKAGSVYQKGFGIGSSFRRFVSWIIPLLRQHALPIAKEVGKEVIKNVAEIASDAIEGRNITDSTKEKIRGSLEKLSNNNNNNQRGSGNHKYKYKRAKQISKNKSKSSKSKKKLNKIFYDIFDRN